MIAAPLIIDRPTCIIRSKMLPRIVQTWTAWLCLFAVGLTSAIVPKGSGGNSGLVLCVGCDEAALTIGAPCSPTYDCCQCNGKPTDKEASSIASLKDDACGCLDVAFPSNVPPFTIHASVADDLKFIAFAPVIIVQVCSEDLSPQRLRHRSAIEPPWELVPSSRATVLLI